MERLTKWEDDRTASVNGSSPIDKDMARAINRLAELEDAIEDERLVELPCKVGDNIYYLDEYRKIIRERTVAGFEVVGDNVSILTNYGDVIIQPDFIEKIAFLTRAEAEKRLKQIKENNNESSND